MDAPDEPGSRLSTPRLELRWLTPADAGLLLAVWNDPAFVRHVGDRGVRTVDAAAEAMAAGPLAMYRDYGYGPYRVALRESGEAIGMCGLFRRPALDDPDIGFALLPAYCGKGYAFEAAQAVLKHARNRLGLGRLTAIVSPGNATSIRLIEKLGLRFERPIRMPGDETDVSLYGIDWT